MPDNEVMMFVMRLLGSLLSLVSLSAPWLLTDPLDCLHLTRTRGNAVQSAPGRQPCGQWPQSSHASFVHESGLWHFFNKSAWYFCPVYSPVRSMCDLSKGKLSVSQSALGQKPRANDCFVCGNSTWEGMQCSYDCLLKYFNNRPLNRPLWIVTWLCLFSKV